MFDKIATITILIQNDIYGHDKMIEYHLYLFKIDQLQIDLLHNNEITLK